MAIDLLAVVLLVGFVVFGARRGTLASGLRIAVLILSYLAAYFVGTQLATPIAEATGLLPLLGMAVAGAVAFVGAFAILTVISSRVLSRDRELYEDFPRATVDRIGGGTIGFAQGILVALLLGWLGLWIEAGRVTGSFDFHYLSGPSIVRSASQNVIGASARAALGEAPAARVGTNLIANPAETLMGIQDVLGDPRMRVLQDDAVFWQYVSTGAFDQALNRASFLGIAYDETMRGKLVDLGLASEASRHDARLFRDAMRELLGQAAPALRDLKNDPELRQLARDPEIRRALSDRDTLSLLAHPGFQRLFARVLARTGSN